MSCPDRPLCEGRIVPRLDGLILVEWAHRSLALASTLIVVVAWRYRGFARSWSLLSLASLLVTAGIGGLAILNEMRIHPLFSAIDQGTAMVTFGILVALAARAHAAMGAPVRAR